MRHLRMASLPEVEGTSTAGRSAAALSWAGDWMHESLSGPSHQAAESTKIEAVWIGAAGCQPPSETVLAHGEELREVLEQ